MRNGKELGAIVIEATISLTIFVFTIFTILSVVNICYVQAKIGIALDLAAKEISQYSYLYYKLGVNKLDAKTSNGTEEYVDMSKETIDGVIALTDSLQDVKNSASTADFDKMIDSMNSSASSVDSLVAMYADKISDNPKEFILGIGKMAGSQLIQEAKSKLLGETMAKAFMKKNLISFSGDTTDAFLKRYHVSNLDFDNTVLMAYGKSNKIQLCVTYDVEVLKLLNIDFKFKFRQVAITNAWGNGIIQIQSTTTETKESLWDKGDAERGKLIVEEEKKNYQYNSSKYFDAYDNTGGKNEFVTIVSMDTVSSSTYNTSDSIKNKISTEYNKIYTNLNKIKGDSIDVVDKNGNNVSLPFDKSSYTYKIVVIVPENASNDIINQAKNDFIKDRKFLGDSEKISIEIKKAYGQSKVSENTDNIKDS